jgi:ribosomal protein S18 acetylase RimI-like enzyme
MTRIRAAAADDAEAIGLVQTRAWQVAYDGHMPADFLASLDPAASAERWRDQRLALTPDQAVFVAEDPDGTVVGFAACGDEQTGAGAGQVFAIYVDPERWSTGAGRALMDAAVAHLTAAGPRPVLLWALDGNERARRFYERYGFVADGATAGHAIPGGEVPILRFTLPAAT